MNLSPKPPAEPPPYRADYPGERGPGYPPPYGTPVYLPAGPAGMPYQGDDVAPPVLLWFRLYMVLASLQYLTLTAFGIAGMVTGGFRGSSPKASDVAVGVVCIGLGCVFALPHGVLLFAGRRPWVHTMGSVLLALSIVGGGGCCSIPALALLIFWVKPETKRWFDGP